MHITLEVSLPSTQTAFRLRHHLRWAIVSIYGSHLTLVRRCAILNRIFQQLRLLYYQNYEIQNLKNA